jgi:hypothetical protein
VGRLDLTVRAARLLRPHDVQKCSGLAAGVGVSSERAAAADDRSIPRGLSPLASPQQCCASLTWRGTRRRPVRSEAGDLWRRFGQQPELPDGRSPNELRRRLPPRRSAPPVQRGSQRLPTHRASWHRTISPAAPVLKNTALKLSRTFAKGWRLSTSAGTTCAPIVPSLYCSATPSNLISYPKLAA